MQFAHWMERMAGVWSFPIILRVVEAVVAMDMDVVEVRTQNVMSVVNLVILHESVACALAHEAWEVVVVEAPVLAAVEVQVMGMGAGVIAPVREDLQDAGAFHLAEVAAIAGPLHIVMAAVIHLMLLATEAGSQTENRQAIEENNLLYFSSNRTI